MSRNMYKHPEYEEMIKRLFSGWEFTFASIAGFDTKTMAQTSEDQQVSGRAIRPRKKKTYD
jgi:hypothetical protein